MTKYAIIDREKKHITIRENIPLSKMLYTGVVVEIPCYMPIIVNNNCEIRGEILIDRYCHANQAWFWNKEDAENFANSFLEKREVVKKMFGYKVNDTYGFSFTKDKKPFHRTFQGFSIEERKE